MGFDPYNYDVNYVTLSLRYRFGGAEPRRRGEGRVTVLRPLRGPQLAQRAARRRIARVRPLKMNRCAGTSVYQYSRPQIPAGCQ